MLSQEFKKVNTTQSEKIYTEYSARLKSKMKLV